MNRAQRVRLDVPVARGVRFICLVQSAVNPAFTRWLDRAQATYIHHSSAAILPG
ncbi:hypothetical protein [Paraburkholderia strydomiana]